MELSALGTWVYKSVAFTMLLSSRHGVRGEGVAENSRPLEQNRKANTELGRRQGGQDQAGLSHQGHTQLCCVSLPCDRPHGKEQVQNET